MDTQTVFVPNAFTPSSQPTPSMRRSDLVNVGRTHAHQTIVKNTLFTLAYESAILLYLTTTTCLLTLPISFSLKCAVDPKVHTLHFLMFVLWPTLCARLIIYLKLRNDNYVRMQNCLFFLTIFYNVSYGVWTVYNFEQILELPHNQGCKSNGTNVLELNYEITIIFGVLPTLVTAVCTIGGVICSPYLLYILLSNWRR